MQFHGPLTARVISRDEIITSAAQSETFVWFVRIGEQYYAFGSDGTTVPVNLLGDLEEGVILTYDGDDPDNIQYDIDRIFTNESSATGDIRVTMKSVKTGQHVFPNGGNIFVDTDYEWERINLHTITNVADGNNINTDLGNLMYSNNNLLVGYTETGFQPLSLNYTTAPRAEQEVLYCAIVDDSIVVDPDNPDPDNPDPDNPDPDNPDPDNPEPDNPEPDEPEEATFTASVITRQELVSLVAQGKSFVWFVRSGNQYYALGSSGEAVPVNIAGTLQQGATLTYSGEEPNNITWDFDSIRWF